jgi:hypothetical protein
MIESLLIIIVNHEEHLRRAIADTGASSSIIPEAYSSTPSIKNDKNDKNDDCNKTRWSVMGDKFSVNYKYS